MPHEARTPWGDLEAAGGEATFLQTDIGDREQVARLVAKTRETYGRLDVAINTAASTGGGSVHARIREGDFDTAVSVTLPVVCAGMKHEIRQMRTPGRGGHQRIKRQRTGRSARRIDR